MTCLIDNKLFVGSLLDGTDLNFLNNSNIKSIIRILNYGNTVSDYPEFTTKTYHIFDDIYEDITPIAIDVYNDYKTLQHPMLIHCHMGYSRSVCCCAYILVKEGYCSTVNEALQFIASKKTTAPNPSFVKQIKRLLS